MGLAWAITHSKPFKILARQIFKKADKDGSGSINEDELTIAFMYFTFELNRRFAGVAEPPTRKEVNELMAEYDQDNTGELQREEMVDLLCNWYGEHSGGLLWAIGKFAAWNILTLPLLAKQTKKALCGNRKAEPVAKKVPEAVLAPIIGAVLKVSWGLGKSIRPLLQRRKGQAEGGGKGAGEAAGAAAGPVAEGAGKPKAK